MTKPAVRHLLRDRRALGAALFAAGSIALAAGLGTAHTTDTRAAVFADTVPQYDLNRLIDPANVLGGMNMAAHEDCSTGFGMHSGTRYFISTAGHCGKSGQGVFVPLFNPPTGLPTEGHTQVGTITANGLPEPDHPEKSAVDDTALITIDHDGTAIPGADVIDTVSPSGGIGTKTVVGTIAQGDLYAGETLCLAGARTGLHCGLRVVAPTVAGPLPDGYQTQGTIGLQAPTGTIGACPGDSGSPVYAIIPGTNGILAVGTTTAVNISEVDDNHGDGDCTLRPGVAAQDIYVTPIAQYTALLGAELNFGSPDSLPHSN